jgi:hypothetical protein
MVSAERCLRQLPRLAPEPRVWLGRLPQRLAKKYAGHDDRDRRRIQWMLTLGPGDVINNCTLFNHVISAPPEVWWRPPLCFTQPMMKDQQRTRRRGKNGYRMLRRGLVVGGIEFETAGSGGCSGFHCGILPALDHALLLAQLKEYERPSDDAYYDPWRHELVLRMDAGETVLDSNRLLIPTATCPDGIKAAYERNVKALEQFRERKR